MKKIRGKFAIYLLAFFMLLGSLFLGASNVKAASGGYTIKPAGESNENVNIDNGNYVIVGDPGQTVELKLTVLNQENKQRKFLYEVNTAYTSDNGSLSFDKAKVTDPSLKIQTKNTADPQKAVFPIPANNSATLTFKITIPKKAFTGYLMGGVSVSPYGEKAKGTVGSNGTLLKNKFSYSIPIQIHQKGAENDEPKYSITSVKPNVVNAKKPTVGVLANVHNSTNSYSGDMKLDLVVTQKGNKDFKIKQSSNSQNIAPTSNYDFSIPWGKNKLQSGSYHLKMTYKTAGGIKSWVLNKDFTITNNDAAKYNKLAGVKPNYLWLWILLGVLALAIILGLGIYLGRRNNNKDNGNNNSSNTRRRRR